MNLIANRQMHMQRVGLIAPGETFAVHDRQDAQSLIESGLARYAPMATYETKVIIPAPPPTPVVVPPEFFRKLYMPHAGAQEEVLAGGDRVLPGTDVPAAGIADPPRRKRGRPRKVHPE